MQILNPGPNSPSTGPPVLIFGLGLIGSAIRDSLLDLGYGLHLDVSFDWNVPINRQPARKEIELACLELTLRFKKLAVVWSAGDAAFHSSAKDIVREFDTFLDSIQFVKRLQNSLSLDQLKFHFISSAGGLFEGQRLVTTESHPTPLRPYGQLKLDQEQALLAQFNPSELLFYRPSSVYGPTRQNHRKGLINNLVNNGRRAKVTVLDARIMSLRDYVFSQDIGRFVARSVLGDAFRNDQRPERFLVSARCSSIFEVVQKVQRILNLNLKVRYDEHFGNNRNITFSDRIFPIGWKPVTLDVGLRQFLVQAHQA
jgi:UDP-glucose 4-epimerase